MGFFPLLLCFCSAKFPFPRGSEGSSTHSHAAASPGGQAAAWSFQGAGRHPHVSGSGPSLSGLPEPLLAPLRPSLQAPSRGPTRAVPGAESAGAGGQGERGRAPYVSRAQSCLPAARGQRSGPQVGKALPALGPHIFRGAQGGAPRPPP